MKSILVATMLLIPFVALSAQQPKTIEVHGHVTDPKGAVVAGAAVFARAYRKQADKIELVAHSDRNGDFTLTLPQDAYDVIVSSLGFKSVLRTVVASPGNSAAIAFKLPIEDCNFPGVNCDTFR